MSNNLYPLLWLLKAKVTGRVKPLVAVNFITEQCELACVHCSFAKKQSPYIKSYFQINNEFEYCFREGARHLYLDGGEPLLWREGEYNLQSLVNRAKRIGFHRVAVLTSAWEPFDKLKTNEIIVSLDGIGRYHEELRGKGTFKRLVENVSASKHRNISALMTVNTKNHRSLEETVRFAASNPSFRRIYVNFHTSFSKGGGSLVLDEGLKSSIIDRLIELKGKGYPVANSVSGLKLVKAGRKECVGVRIVPADGELRENCPSAKDGVCSGCGLTAFTELTAALALKRDAIAELCFRL